MQLASKIVSEIIDLEEVICRKIHYFNDFFVQLASKIVSEIIDLEEVICYSCYNE